MLYTGFAKTIFRAALLAGIVVGLGEALRIAWLGNLGFLDTLMSVGLVLGYMFPMMSAVGVALAALIIVAGWGRNVTLAWPDRLLGWVLVGVLAGIPAFLTVAATAARNNRFIAAGVVALVACAVGLGMAFVGPAFSRTLAFLRRAKLQPLLAIPNVTWGGILLLVPLVCLVLLLGLFLLVWQTRAPLRKAVILERGLWAALLTALIPWSVSIASQRLRRMRGFASMVVAAIVFGLPMGLVIARRWAKDFQFLPWADVGVVVALLLCTVIFTQVVFRPWSRRRWWQAGTMFILALPMALALTEREAVRKVVIAKSGIVGRLLLEGQRKMDWDGDGYARWFGGGDCDDGDGDRNPGARDWPGDGIDQDCDGKDAALSVLRSPPFFSVPDSVPADLNILLVTIDTLRADHLGCYGYSRPTSPRLDALAKESTLFENGWAHAPSTRYSMPAIVTGRWPSAIAWDESIWWPRIAPTQRTLAESLQALGYTTGGFFAYLYFNLADRRGFERGMDHYDDRCAALHRNLSGPAESVGSSARQMSDKAIAFLREHASRKFYLWLHYYDPHLNYERHPEAPDFGSSQADLYDGEIWFTDFQFGRVLDEIRQQGLWDKTAIVVVGDHGESLGEHGIVAHGYHLYSPHTKVPFVLKIPGLPAQRLTVPMGHVDLAPTLVNLARGPHEPAYLGRSFVDYLAGQPRDPTPEPVFQEVSYEGNVKRRAVVTASHHLIWNWTPDNTTECYDLAQDPGENLDLWGKDDEECLRLKSWLRDRVGLLSLPPGYGEKIAFGVHRIGDPIPPPKFILGARIGQGLEVLGYDLEPEPVPSQGRATLVTHLQVTRPIEPGYRMFFHLDGPGGFRNLDHALIEGAYPMERWRPGQRLRDRLILTPSANMPKGTYSLYIGLFKGADRLPITPDPHSDGQKRLRLLSFQVD
jgi:hypothetical protein